MCGIVGYLTGAPVAPDTLERMADSLRHRGPDDAGYHLCGPFGGGMRRLAINDVAHGHQPLFNRDRSVALFYNGEIYNSPALRRDMEARGHVFVSHSDGEVICHLYDEIGEAAFERLDGMFGAALWDRRRRRLILARDLAGEKPLYYAPLGSGGLVFASELKALRRFPGLSLTLNRQGLWDLPSFNWIPEPDTVFTEVKALPRGHLLIAEAGGLRLKPLVNRFDPGPPPADDAGAVALIRRVVTDAVTSRLLSDVPVGSFLSSGLDSSIVATLAARQLGRLTTFCVGFEDIADPYHGRADESEAAAAYARILGSDHHTVRVTAARFRALLDRFCRHGDQPQAVSSGLGILAVAQAAREHGIKVLLSGDGADECFGGYAWYAHLAAAGRLPAAAPPAGGEPVSFQTVGLPLADRLAILAGYPGPLRAWAWHYYAAESEKAALFAPDFAAGQRSSLRHFEAFKPDPAWTPDDFIGHDRAFYLPFEMMPKLDRMTMAASVEGRAPFVAAPVLALADHLGHDRMVRGDTLKWGLRQAFADLLPEAVRRRPKHGFNVPIDDWLKGDWADLRDHAFSRDSALARHGFLARDAAGTARALLHQPRRLNGHTVFSFIMINMWLEQTP